MAAYHDLPASNAVGFTHHTLFLHLLHNPGRTIISDLQVTLDKTRRGFAFPGDKGHRFVIIGIIGIAGAVLIGERNPIVDIFRDLSDVMGFRLPLQKVDYMFHFLIANEGTVNAGDLAAARHV